MSQLRFKNIVKGNTRGTALLDLCFISRKAANDYRSVIEQPLSNSDHNSVVIFRNTVEKKLITVREVFDLRESNLKTFTNDLNNVNWNFLYALHYVNKMVSFYHTQLQRCMNKIPIYQIKSTNKDKEWITPLCKHLINLRWKAFRAKNFILYKHYQNKLKLEIPKAKNIWAQKCRTRSTGLWNVVKNCSTKQILAYINKNFR